MNTVGDMTDPFTIGQPGDRDPLKRAALDDAVTWVAAADPDRGVGSRHHTVPRFYLKNFALKDQLLVRRIPDSTPMLNSIYDLAQRDFYTVVTDDGAGGTRLDGRLEQVLAKMEGNAKPAIAKLRNPLIDPERPLDPGERLQLDQFVAFQLVRGVRTRREKELLAEYTLKSMIQGRPGPDGQPVTLDQLARVRAVPHPNDHLRHIGEEAELVQSCLADRPYCLIEVDKAALIICDEPVLVSHDNDPGHRPECQLTIKERRRRMDRAMRRGQSTWRDLLHIRVTRPRGVAMAEEIAIPLDPRRLLIYGPRGANTTTVYQRIIGDDASELIDNVNELLLGQAYLWAAAHPDHPSFATMSMSEPGPLVVACDGSTPIAESLRNPPEPRQPARLRKNWRT
jgi:hypothetical protein